MNWRDKDVILESVHYKLIYNENFVSMPFCVVDKISNARVGSYSSERSGRAAVRHYDKKLENQTVS